MSPREPNVFQPKVGTVNLAPAAALRFRGKVAALGVSEAASFRPWGQNLQEKGDVKDF